MTLFDGETKAIKDAGRNLVLDILHQFRCSSKKRIVVIKTPDDIRYIDELSWYFPDAHYIHIVRDGRDVAVSTLRVAERLYSLFEHGDVTIGNALGRWTEWNETIEQFLCGLPERRKLECKYEELVSNSVDVLARVCGFLGVRNSATMHQYWNYAHTYPGFEAGSEDVKSRREIENGRVGVWRNCGLPWNELIDVSTRSALLKYGYMEDW